MTKTGGIAEEALKQYFDRIERLEAEKKALAEDIKDIYAEAKSTGFDPKIMRIVVRRRKMDEHDRNEQDTIVDLYEHAVGLTPLEEYAANKLDQTYKSPENQEKEFEKSVKKDLDELKKDHNISTGETENGTPVITITPKEDLFDQAVKIIFRDEKASVSYLQRQLQIGYNRAASIIDKLEQKKYISSAGKTGKRTINQTAKKRFNKLLNNDSKEAAE